MICPDCRTEAEPDSAYCGECGRSLTSTNKGPLESTTRKSFNRWWLGGVALLLVIGAALAGVLLSNPANSNQTLSASNSTRLTTGTGQISSTSRSSQPSQSTTTTSTTAPAGYGASSGSPSNPSPSSTQDNSGNSGNSGSTGSGTTGNTATTTTPPTTTTTTVPLTSAQQAFANAVTSQLPLYVSSTNPPLTPSAIANVGSEICTAFSIGASQYVSGGGGPPQDADSFVYQAMLPELANGAIEGGSGSVAVPPISGGGTDTLINLAIQNLCSQYSDGIPSG